MFEVDIILQKVTHQQSISFVVLGC